jgi:nucleoside-diphosphate-sugar epimerase
MKIVITGRSAGIGKALGDILESRGHEIIGISRRDKENIRRIPHTANLIESCDGFINNAQEAYAQTELLYAVWEKWQGQPKWIWNISTMMTEQPTNSKIEGFSDALMSAYRNQKLALEEATKQLRSKNRLPTMSIIRPGQVNTQGAGGIDVDVWAKQIIDAFIGADVNSCQITEISLGPSSTKLGI